ncbi:MAG TPA: hypothetical protein VLB90_02440 [Pseudomonadales bacterium]|nr:hypothetical protein [Pseudomonadales bacterium]
MDILKQFFCRIFFAFVATLLFFHASFVVADIYKCTQADGSLQFSDALCEHGTAEPVVLIENSALDSTAERENIARYQQQALREQKKSHQHKPSALLITDTYAEERNARITAAEHKVSNKKKKKKRSKAKAGNEKKRSTV